MFVFLDCNEHKPFEESLSTAIWNTLPWMGLNIFVPLFFTGYIWFQFITRGVHIKSNNNYNYTARVGHWFFAALRPPVTSFLDECSLSRPILLSAWASRLITPAEFREKNGLLNTNNLPPSTDKRHELKFLYVFPRAKRELKRAYYHVCIWNWTLS